MESIRNIAGRIHSLESFGAVDGPGVRFVVFLQGCPLRCRYCHNPDTWEPAGGRSVAVGEILDRIDVCRNFIRSGGVTLSGGEPLLQPEFVRALLAGCRALGFHTALDTAAPLPPRETFPVAELADLILLDIKAADPALCRELTGRDNRNAFALLDYCEAIGKPVWIRHVLVPGVTLVRDRLEMLAERIGGRRCVEKVELLPFHKLGQYKYRELGISFPLAETPEPAAEELEMAREPFLLRNLPL